MTADPDGFVSTAAEGPEEVRKSLAMALADAMCLPVLDEPESWPGWDDPSSPGEPAHPSASLENLDPSGMTGGSAS